MKCPHCGRAWSAADLDAAGGLPSTIIISDHVNRFCPGQPDAPIRVRQVVGR